MTASKIQRYDAAEAASRFGPDAGVCLLVDHIASLTTLTAERDEAVRIGKQFEADARKHFDQSCINLARADTAERRVRELEKALKSLIAWADVAAYRGIGTPAGPSEMELHRAVNEARAALTPPPEPPHDDR